MNVTQNYKMLNYQSKFNNNNQKITFKAGTQIIKSAGKSTQNSKIKMATCFTSLLAGISTLLGINSVKTSKNDGKLIIEKANQTMKYIENLPEYKASNFRTVTAGCHSKEVQFGPIKMEDGSTARINFNVMDYPDGTALLTKTLAMEDEKQEWYASTREIASTSKYNILKELEENISRGHTKWKDFYDRTTHTMFDKKGRSIS